MSRLHLELYEGPIPRSMAALPGASNYSAGTPNLFWAILSSAFPPGSPEAIHMSPEGPTATATAVSHGTDTLPAGTTAFAVVEAAIWDPKYPPYRFELTAPDGTTVLLSPPPGGDNTAWYARALAIPDGRGIWVVRVTRVNAQDLPRDIDGRRAHLNPAELAFTPAEFYKQPLLRLDVERGRDTCPEVDGVTAEGCTPGQVTLRVAITGDLADIQVLSCDYGDGSVDELAGGQIVGPSPIGFGPHGYGTGAHTAIVTLLRRQGCSPLVRTRSIALPSCPGDCPTLEPIEILSGCAAGRVTIRVRITGDLALASQLTVSWADGQSQTIDHDALHASQDLAHTYANVPAGRIVATLDRIDSCDPHVDAADVAVPVCPSDACPELQGIDVDGCAGERAVNLTADVTNPGLVEAYQWDFGDGQSATGGPTVSHTYAARREHTVQVTVRRPARCEPRSVTATATVSPCSDDDGGGGDDHPPDTQNGNGGPFPSCAALLMLALTFLIAGAVLLGVGICLASSLYLWATGYWWIIGVVVAAVGAALLVLGHVLLLLWFALCGSCPENCPLLELLIDVLVFLVAVSGLLSLVAAFLGWLGLSTLCWVGWVIDVADFGILLALAIWYARLAGCMPWPRWVPEWARPRVPDALRSVCDALAGRSSARAARVRGQAIRQPQGFTRHVASAGAAAAKAGFRVARGQRVLAAADLVDRRTAVCATCAFYRAGRCTQCGCRISLKARLLTERCPLDLWPAP